MRVAARILNLVAAKAPPWKMKTKIILACVIAVLAAIIVQGRYEVRKAREDYFKRGLYYGVKSLRILMENDEQDITWDNLYVCAIMMEFDSKEKHPLYNPLKAPLDVIERLE